MKILTTTQARTMLSELVNRIRYKDETVAIGRRNTPEVLMIRYPSNQNLDLSEETNINANSVSFDFLKDEPDLYTVDDLKKRYADT